MPSRARRPSIRSLEGTGPAGPGGRLDQLVDRPRRHTLDMGLSNDRRQRLLRQPSRLQETRKIRAHDPARAGSSVCRRHDGQKAVEGAASGGAARPSRRASPRPGRGRRCATPAARYSSRPTPHRSCGQRPTPSAGSSAAEADCEAARASRPGRQPLGGKAQHLAQEVSVGRLLQKTLKGHHLVGHRFGHPVRIGCATRPYRRTADGRRQLHHHQGHDLKPRTIRLIGSNRAVLLSNTMEASR